MLSSWTSAKAPGNLCQESTYVPWTSLTRGWPIYTYAGLKKSHPTEARSTGSNPGLRDKNKRSRNEVRSLHYFEGLKHQWWRPEVPVYLEYYDWVKVNPWGGLWIFRSSTCTEWNDTGTDKEAEKWYRGNSTGPKSGLPNIDKRLRHELRVANFEDLKHQRCMAGILWWVKANPWGGLWDTSLPQRIPRGLSHGSCIMSDTGTYQ